MTSIINEWQLDSRLNVALQSNSRSNFAYYLALLSPSVDESAQFFTPESELAKVTTNSLYQRLNIRQARPFDLQDGDVESAITYSKALQVNGLNQVKLLSYLRPSPIVFKDDKQKLDSEVWQNLDLHSRRRREGTNDLKQSAADPTLLYDILQQLDSAAVA